ncbi:hypothetical protein H4R99_000079 [Coemansia sp. RSA 1722]|nr:hypothetical protein H4R99_000079 [Coemansia sp. RSA 1722]
MSISPYGRDVVLAGRAGLAIVDLEFPFSPARTIPISSKWKITGVEWCPNTQHHGWVATPVSQTLLIHDLSHNTTKPMLVIKAHPTTITDVAWVPKIPSWIGTASIDPVIKIWDARRDQKPVWYFSKWEPTDLLAFNNVHMHKMASVHRNKIAVWDIRYGSSPLTVMEDAHSEDIVSISWHPDLQDTLVSAGQDRTVKQWRIKYASATEKYSHLLSHDIVSADYLPFGEGILVKQRSPDNEVLVIKDTPQFTPVHRFIGHTDTVVASSWRIQGARVGEDGKDSRDFQLVTWGDDQVMRMWSTSIKMVDAVGGNPSRLARDMQDLAPSFATNYIGPDKIMHLIEQRALPSELLLASAGGFGSQKITTMHEFDRAGNMLEGIRLVSTSEAHGEAPLSAQSQSTAEKSRDKESLVTPTTARTSTADDHSSDDDDDVEYDEYDFDGASGGRRKKEKGTVPDISDWREEMKVTVQERYSKSKTVSIKDIKPESRLCRLTVGIPWITRETLVLRVTFPMNYPAFPAQFGVEFISPVFGSRAGIVEHLIGVADSCAAQGVPALDHCLYSLLKMLIPKARAKSMPHKSRSGSIKADDLERLPPPPPKLLWETVDDRISKRDLAHSAAALSRKINKFSQQDSLLPPAAGQSDSRQPKRDSVSRDTQRWTPSSLPSDGNMSAMSNDEDGDNYNGYTVSEDEHLDDGYFDKGKHSSDSSSRGSEDEEEEDDDFAMGYDGDNYEQTYYSDFSQSEIPLDNDGIPIMSRHVNSHERYDARTPFPRLCGGVFSGPGTLICFFASIYTPDTYPDPIGHGQQARSNRERTREDMYQQLRKITKPRNFYELKPYQGMVQFGLQNKGAYFSFNGGNGTTGASGDALHMANGRKHSNGRRRSSSLSGFDDSDDDGEARDEEVPRFYYRKQISHNTFSDSDDESDAHSTYFKPVALTRVDKGVGNMALLCTVPKDRSANYELAKQFELVGQSTEWICRHNATVADLNGRKGLAHIWTMLACLLGPVLSGSDGNVSARIWSTHPPLVRWLRSVMVHYERRGDVQTLALLSCVLSKASAEASALMGEEHSGFRAGACGHSDANAVVHDAAGVNIASNELVTGADVPPWMAAASAGAAAAAAVGSKSSLSQISALRPKGRSRVGWDILGTSAAEAVAAAAASAAFTGNTKQARAASQGDQLQTSPNLNPSQMAVAAQRAVSFAVPATFVSAAVSTGASATASASASAMGVAGVTSTVDPSSSSMTSAMHVATQSQTPPPTNTLAEAAAAAAAAAASSSSGMQISETMNMAAAEAFLGRRIAGNDNAQRFSMLFSTNQMSLVPQHTDGSTAPVLYNGMPASIDPLSPEILQELDSEEIKQNEMMMAEGLDDLHALLTREPTPDSSAPVTGNSETGHMSLDNHAGNAGDEPDACADGQQRSSSEHANERSSAEPDTAENLWKRLRSNVLGRVQTAAPAGTKPGSLEMASSPPSVAAAHTMQPITEAVSPDMVAKAKPKVKPKASTRGNSAKHGKSWLMTHNWVPLLSGKEGVAAQAVAKELAYLRTKREFERLHTRLVMRDRSEWADDDDITFGSNSSDYRMQAPYLDHWKLLYARDLYKWNMNIKAVEVLKCVQDPVLREFYNQMYCQPTVPVHDNLPRIANPVISGRNNQEKEAEAEAEAVKRPRAVSEAEEFRSDVGTESGTDTTMEIGGAPWLACAWCHEYVHGCALICHACGHGGHQEHMQRWFGIVRKQLLRTGLAPARYSRTGATVNNSNSSSTSNLQRGVSSSSMGQKKLTVSAVANSGHLAVGSNVTASDYLSSFVNSPVAGPSEAIAPISSVLPGLSITEPSSDAAQKGPGPDIEIIATASSSISSSNSSSSSSSSSDDGENARGTSNGNSPGSAASNAYSLFTPMQYDHIVSVKQNGWESSEGESDDHLHFPQDNVLLMSGLGGTKLRRLRKTVPLTPQNSQNGEENVHEDAFRMQLDIPTCPSGCGCNCLYETRRAIL